MTISIRYISFISLAICIMLSGYVISQQAFFHQGRQLLAWGVAADVMLIVPLLYYVLIYKTGKQSKTPLYLLVYLGALYCYFILPEDVDPVKLYYPYYRYLLIAAVIIAEIYLLYFIVTILKKIRQRSLYGENKIRALLMLLPMPWKIKTVIKSEFLSWYFAFYGRRKPDTALPENSFSYHVRSGAPSLSVCLVIVILVEAPFSHFLIEQVSPTLSWVKTILSLYSCVGFLGFAFAMAHKPVRIKSNSLLLQTSLLWRIEVPFHNIDAISGLSWQQQEAAEYKRRNISFMAAPSLELKLKEPQTLYGPFGIKCQAKVIWFDLDKGSAFVARLKARLSEKTELEI